jgi:hypothetical protein
MTADALLFPVGHYLGAFHPEPGAAVAHHLVRVGFDSHQVPDGDPMDVWSACHGRGGDPLLDPPWTRDAALAAAVELDVPDAARQLDELIARGLVVQVADDAQAADFAARHRLQPLLVGLGNSPEDPYESIGVPGLPVAARVRPRVGEVWEWVGLWPSLAAARQAFAGLAEEAGREVAGTAGELRFLLGAVQSLVGASAAFLDTAGGGRPARRHDLPPLRG